jgi:hypothetical protein
MRMVVVPVELKDSREKGYVVPVRAAHIESK